jgi:demethylmenaquinone methyltransferase/2-methoxy-6-polyprenyl-1,4-benzoquinol methylase
MSQAALMDYYRRRAGKYERIYQKPGSQTDLACLREYLRLRVAGRPVLELACGTGYWTAAAADIVDSIPATDASEELLAIASAKGLEPAHVSFSLGDAYHPVRPEHDFTAGLAAFWWSHIPRERRAAFLVSFHAALAPGARVVFADNRFVEGSSTPICRTDTTGNTYQLRQLQDGTTHEVLRNFPSSEELHDILKPYSGTVEVTEFDYFWCASYDAHRA